MRTLSAGLLFICVAAGAAPASAQGTDRSIRSIAAGGFVSGLGLNDESGLSRTSPGLGGWVTFDIADPLAIEAQVAWFPRNEPVEFEAQGGRTLKITVGAKGRFFESSKIRLFGLMSTGLIRFSATEIGPPDGRTFIGSRTHLALDLGAALELFPDRRWSPRIDVAQSFYEVPGASFRSEIDPSVVLTHDGKIADTYQITAGVTYNARVRRRGPSSATPSSRRLTIGPQLAYSDTAAIGDLSPASRAGLGAFASYRLTPNLYADGTIAAYFGPQDVRTPWDGGRSLQMLGGIKAGVTRDRVGLFAKARIGVTSYSEVIVARDSAARRLETGRSYLPALDLGGVIEVAAGPRLVARFEASDILTFYSERTIVSDGVPLPQPRLPARSSMQMSVGIGWRFR